ncbi:unnamed protein product [Xylocopa violacea]|uniref:Small ribosomal subunit protein mS29 n=1 Tax=Xylocopa violacea TaxID=135666 RepID=A0ABP1N6Y9_XYLVO
MMPYTYSLFSRLYIANVRRLATNVAAKEVQDINIAPFRIVDPCPVQHDESCLNRIYTVPPDITMLLKEHMPKELWKQASVFREFDGRVGVGKSTTLMHLIHYGLTKQFFIIYLPWVCTWFRYARDAAVSPLNPEKLDIPTYGVRWLTFFKQLNHASLSQFDLKVSKEYTWSPKEHTTAGESLSALIEFGIERTKFACGVIDALVNELKVASTAGKCKTLIVIDGFNAFTSAHTLIRDDSHIRVPPDRISITSTFFNSVNYDWCNGAAILTVDKKANKERRESDYPTYLLGKKGFEQLDPFLPICVEPYSREEFKTIIEYYKDRKWIRDISPQGEKEMEMLCARIPADIWHFTKPL